MVIAAALNSHAQSAMELTATEVAAQMAPGWNLGNTMEAGDSKNNYTNKGGLKAETSWQDTPTTQEIINYVRSLGFRSIRIPCAWIMGHISDASTYTIDPVWMNRVKEIVDYSLKAGLYVVINQHWDGGWLENNIAATDPNLIAKNKYILRRIWEQIAETFKDYDERLVFAGLNEPNADDQAATNKLRDYEEVFIDVVRNSGGNNLKRVLIIQGPGTDPGKTCSYMKTLPSDPTADRLMIEVHYYNPWQWWGMEKDESWGNAFYYWGAVNHVSGSTHNSTSGEEADMEKILQNLKTQFVDKGIPVYIGEFGANWRSITGAGESQEKHNSSIQYHYKTFMEKCFQKGMVPVVWDTNYRGRPSMTIINRKDQSIYNEYMIDGVHEAMIEAGVPVSSVQQVFDRHQKGTVYDLQGHCVSETVASPLSSGIYICDGKKFVVR